MEQLRSIYHRNSYATKILGSNYLDNDGVQVPNDVIKNKMSDRECFYFENGNILPCRMD